MVGSKRKEDNRQMSIVNDFIDTYVYPKINEIIKCIRVDDKKNQLRGIDILIKTTFGRLVCDEKSAVNYRRLNTFAFELDSLNNVGGTGWLLNDELKTDTYVLCWIDESKSDIFGDDGKPIKKILKDKDDITDMTISFVSKKTILDYIESNGFNEDALKEKVLNIRKYKKRDEVVGNLKFKLSDQLVEEPINVILKRNEIIKNSMITYRIKNFKVNKIK